MVLLQSFDLWKVSDKRFAYADEINIEASLVGGSLKNG